MLNNSSVWHLLEALTSVAPPFTDPSGCRFMCVGITNCFRLATTHVHACFAVMMQQQDGVNQLRTGWNMSVIVLSCDCRQDITGAKGPASHGWWCDCGFERLLLSLHDGLGCDKEACERFLLKYVCIPHGNHIIHRVSPPQVLPAFLGAEWSVLQRDGLLRPGEYAQVSVKAARLFFLILILGINRKHSKMGKYHNFLHKLCFPETPTLVAVAVLAGSYMGQWVIIGHTHIHKQTCLCGHFHGHNTLRSSSP